MAVDRKVIVTPDCEECGKPATHFCFSDWDAKFLCYDFSNYSGCAVDFFTKFIRFNPETCMPYYPEVFYLKVYPLTLVTDGIHCKGDNCINVAELIVNGEDWCNYH